MYSVSRSTCPSRGPVVAGDDTAVRAQQGVVGRVECVRQVGGRGVEGRCHESGRAVAAVQPVHRALVAEGGEALGDRVRELARGLCPCRRVVVVAEGPGQVRHGVEAAEQRCGSSDVRGAGAEFPVVRRSRRQSVPVQGRGSVVGRLFDRRVQLLEVRVAGLPRSVLVPLPCGPGDPAVRVELRVTAVGRSRAVQGGTCFPGAVRALGGGVVREDPVGVLGVSRVRERSGDVAGVAGPGVLPDGVPGGGGSTVGLEERLHGEQGPCGGLALRSRPALTVPRFSQARDSLIWRRAPGSFARTVTGSDPPAGR